MSPRVSTLLVAALLLVSSCGGTEPATSTSDPAGPTTAPMGDSSTTTFTDPSSTTTSPESTTTTETPADVGDLLVLGDWGSGTMPQGAVAGAMSRYAEENDVEAILTTGDNFYSDDWEFLMKPFGWATEAEIPFWIAWGNHDIETTARIEAMNQVFDDPPRWTVHEWGGVDIVILDSTQPGDEEQLDFLQTTLAETEDPTIVVSHHPRYSCGSHGDTETLDEWVDAFDDETFLVLAGHEHNYQRYEEGDVTYVVTGGGGATLTELADCPDGHPEMLTGESVHHFMALEHGEEVVTTVFDVNGDVVDEWRNELP